MSRKSHTTLTNFSDYIVCILGINRIYAIVAQNIFICFMLRVSILPPTVCVFTQHYPLIFTQPFSTFLFEILFRTEVSKTEKTLKCKKKHFSHFRKRRRKTQKKNISSMEKCVRASSSFLDAFSSARARASILSLSSSSDRIKLFRVCY